MVKKKQTKKKTLRTKRNYELLFESDGQYLLKLVLCIIFGTLWLKLQQPVIWASVPIHAIPFGLAVGLLLVSRLEHFQSDRKIWYAVLMVVGIISYFVPAGIVI